MKLVPFVNIRIANGPVRILFLENIPSYRGAHIRGFFFGSSLYCSWTSGTFRGNRHIPFWLSDIYRFSTFSSDFLPDLSWPHNHLTFDLILIGPLERVNTKWNFLWRSEIIIADKNRRVYRRTFGSITGYVRVFTESWSILTSAYVHHWQSMSKLYGNHGYFWWSKWG